MALYESYVKMINARLKEVYNYFGEKSPEYQDLASATFSVMGQENVLLSINPKKPLKVIRSKKANEENPLLYQDMQDIWRTFTDYGTLRQMIQRKLKTYKDELGDETISEMKKMWNSRKKIIVDNNGEKIEVEEREIVKDFIREVSQQEYNYKYDDDEIYKNIRDLVYDMNEEEVEDTKYKSELRDLWETFHRTGKGIRDSKFDEIKVKWDVLNSSYEDEIKEKLGIKSVRDVYDSSVESYDIGSNE